MAPRARTEGLQVRSDGSELEISIDSTGEVIRLHAVTATVWRHADGSASVADLAGIVRRELDVEVSEAMLWSSLDLLADHGLLEGRVAPPIAEVAPVTGGELRSTERIRRRSLLTKLGIAGGATVVAGAMNPASAFAKNNKEKDNNAGGLPACKAEEATAKQDASTARAEERDAKQDAATARAEERESKRDAEASNKRAQESDGKEAEAKNGEQECKTGSEEEEAKQAEEQRTKQAQEQKTKQAQEQRTKQQDQEQQAKQAEEQRTKQAQEQKAKQAEEQQAKKEAAEQQAKTEEQQAKKEAAEQKAKTQEQDAKQAQEQAAKQGD